MKLYVNNLQPNLTQHQIVPTKDATLICAKPGDPPLYQTIRRLATHKITTTHILLHVYNLLPEHKRILAYAIATGIPIHIYIESIQQYIDFDTAPARTLHPSQYNAKHSIAQAAYRKIEHELKPHTDELFRVEQEIYQLREQRDDPLFFKLTTEIEDFITLYAPAYGLPIPRFRPLETTCSDYKPPEQSKTGYDLLFGIKQVSDPNKLRAKWEHTERRNKLPTPLKDIQIIYDQLRYYTKHNLPYEHPYEPCTCCGRPVSLQASPFNPNCECTYCDQQHTPLYRLAAQTTIGLLLG